MSRRHDRPTFAEMVRQPTWSEQEASTTGRHAVRPGTYNRAGELFDPEGAPLRKVRDDVTADDARRLLVEGARLVHESCGCGGHGRVPAALVRGDGGLRRARRRAGRLGPRRGRGRLG